MKNAKRNPHKTEDRAEELRRSALRALSKTVLKDVKGGDGAGQTYSTDPIC